MAILARGGGSLEDLQAFNSELVARAIFASRIPVISAVGHETDYTIADFVADLRAPTPSVAAELAVPEKSVLEHRCRELTGQLNSKIYSYYNMLKMRTQEITRRLIDPRREIEDLRLQIDDLTLRLNRMFAYNLRRERENLDFRMDLLKANTPRLSIRKTRIQLDQIYNNLLKTFILFNTSKQIKIRELTAKLEALSPVAILSRGYSITRTIPDARVIKDTRAVVLNQDLEVMVANGRLICRVKGKSTDG